MHYLTYILIRLLLGLFDLLPPSVASALGGKLAQLIGPRTRRHQVALKNLALIYPDKSQQWRDKTVSAMWNHMGRVIAELPGLRGGKLSEHVQVEGAQQLTAAPQLIFVSAHIGQWELLTPVAKQHGVGPIVSMYRHVNNQRVDALLKAYRADAHDELIRKKGDNAIALVRALKEGKSLALLIDQHLTKGDRMPFLGIEAPTNTAAIKLSIKTGVPIVVAFVVRDTHVIPSVVEGSQDANGDPSASLPASAPLRMTTNFKAIVHAPIYPPEQGTDEEKGAAMAREVFDLIEAQIHAHPEQYMWTHNRWKG